MTISERVVDSPTAQQSAACQTPAIFNPGSSNSANEPFAPFKKKFWNRALLALGLIALAVPFIAAIFFAAP